MSYALLKSPLSHSSRRVRSSYVLRNTATDLKLPKKKSCNGERCFSYRGKKMWNDLPEKLSSHRPCIASKKYSVYLVYFCLYLLFSVTLYFCTRFLN